MLLYKGKEKKYFCTFWVIYIVLFISGEEHCSPPRFQDSFHCRSTILFQQPLDLSSMCWMAATLPSTQTSSLLLPPVAFILSKTRSKLLNRQQQQKNPCALGPPTVTAPIARPSLTCSLCWPVPPPLPLLRSTTTASSSFSARGAASWAGRPRRCASDVVGPRGAYSVAGTHPPAPFCAAANDSPRLRLGSRRLPSQRPRLPPSSIPRLPTVRHCSAQTSI